MVDRRTEGPGRLPPGPGQDPELVAADQRARLRAAMTELVYESGYPQVTVQGLLARAHVSKPTFYRLFSGKEDCFAAAYGRAVDEAFSTTRAATAGSGDRVELIDRGLGVLSGVLTARPPDANLVLLEPLAVGEGARARMRHTEAAFAMVVRQRFAELPEPVDLSPSLVRGLISGIGRVARQRLNQGQPAAFGADTAELARWALALTDVDSLALLRERFTAVVSPLPRIATKVPALAADDDRVRLVNAAARIVAERGYEGLAVADVVAGAGLTRRHFAAHFESLDDCFAATVELTGAAAVAQVLAAYRAGPPGPSGISRALAALCRYLALNPGLARLLFVDIFVPGRRVTRRSSTMLSALAKLLRQHLDPDVSPGKRSAEGTAGAIWALIRHEVEQGRAATLSHLTPLLVWFALAPSIADPLAAIEASA